MASTSDMAPTPRKAANNARAAAASADRAISEAVSSSREAELEAQVSQLQADLKDISKTLSKLTGAKVEEAKDYASAEFEHLKRRGQHLIHDAQDQAGEYEKQLKDTIREKPLTAVATAAGIGFVLALLTR